MVKGIYLLLLLSLMFNGNLFSNEILSMKSSLARFSSQTETKCSEEASLNSKEFNFDFTTGNDHDFRGLFKDVHVNQYNNYINLLKSGKSLGPVPPEARLQLMKDFERATWLMNYGINDVADHPGIKGFLMQGVNRSDDMDKYMVRKFKLKPNTTYKIKINDVNLVANDPIATMGPGGGVARNIEALAINTDPYPYVVENNHIRFTKKQREAMKGFRGDNRASVGGTGLCKTQSYLPLPGIKTCERTSDGRVKYMTKKYNNVKEIRVTTNEDGDFWLMLGGHSGHESLDEFYITKMKVSVSEI